jgi:hypothetical protein
VSSYEPSRGLSPAKFALLAVALTVIAWPPVAAAASIFNPHVTDGTFTSPQEWTGPVVAKQFFAPASDGSGGAFLYVEQGISSPFANDHSPFDTLYLLYDYVNSAPGGDQLNSFFDVFFQVSPTRTDYLVRILNTGNPNGAFLAFEKSSATPSNINPDGTFDIGSPWTPLESDDLALARFQVAIGFGPSPDQPTDHLMAEFELSINNPRNPFSPGLYDPSPAFWGASADPKFGPDPPISSAIFELSPDGGASVFPVLGPNGGPIKQPAAAVPEPPTVLLLGSCVALLWKRLIPHHS